MNKYEIIIEAMKKAGFPLSDMQEVLLAGSFSVLIEAAVLAEREACAKVCEQFDTAWDANHSLFERLAKAIRARGDNAS